MSTATPTTGTIRTSDIPVGGYSLRVHQSGREGSPVLLLLHGSGPGATALSNWGKVLDELGESFHCVAPDILGFGDSSHPEDPPVGTGPYAQLRAEVMLSLVDELGLRDVTVLGNSMGGMITLRMLAMAPERFAKVVLMASGGAPVGPTEDLLKLVFYYQDPTPEAMADLMSRFVSDPAVLGDRLDEIAAERMPMALREDVRRSHQATFTLVDEPMIDLEAVDRVTQPVLLINGREDRMIPLEAAYWFIQHLDNAQLHVLPHCGHWVQIEQRDRFVALVRSFVSGEW